jgi:hypothetical protein
MGVSVPVTFADQVEGYSPDIATVSVRRSDVGRSGSDQACLWVYSRDKIGVFAPPYLRLRLR